MGFTHQNAFDFPLRFDRIVGSYSVYQPLNALAVVVVAAYFRIMMRTRNA